MCVSLFSITAHAEAVTNSDISFEMWDEIFLEDGEGFTTDLYAFSYPDSYEETIQVPVSSGMHIWEKHIIVFPDEGFLMKKHNDNSVFSLNDVYYSLLTYDGRNYLYFRDPSSIRAIVYYDGGEMQYFDVIDFSVSGVSLSMQFEFAPDQDVSQVEFIITQEFDRAFGVNSRIVTYFTGEGNNPTFVIVDQPTKTEGLLSGILQKVKDGFQNLKDGLNNVVNSIAELPTKLWEKISDGLKGLFVPSEESMTVYKDKWDDLLASRFGAVYQVVHIMTDSWDGIMNADQTNTIAFPSATINLSGTPFTFGGYDVKVVPDGFDILTTAVKSIVAIISTVAFVNGLRKRYDEIMGVEN